VSVESEIGKGAAFHVYLPRIASAHEVSKPIHSLPLSTGSERILFIDDEEELLTVGREALQHLGYQVITNSNSLQALNEFRERPEHFDLVITDMTMPRMTGEKLARELIQIRPDIPIILFTGYSGQINAQKAREIGIKAFVMKPLTLSHLAQTVREVLDKS
jgi:CheY-like chemotaxis protein